MKIGDLVDPHFVVIGMTGSGKSLIFKTLMGALLPVSGRASNDGVAQLATKSLIYDPKREFYSVLRGIGIPADAITVLHPFDERCSPWDLCADVTDTSTAQQIAAILCPEEEESSHPFFAIAAQEILFAVIEAFRAKPGSHWTLRDIVEATLDRQNLDCVLGWTDLGKETKETYITEHKTTVDILATLRAKIRRFSVVASLWHHATRAPFSLTRWVANPNPSIILLGADSAHSESIGPINRALFQRFSELVTYQDEVPADAEEDRKRQTWIFLDELRLAGNLRGLDALLLEGRSKGARVVIGFQDIEGLYDVYGEFVARELVGQCGNCAVLRLSNPQTMRWASDFVGETRDWRVLEREAASPAQQKREMRDMPAMLPVEFRLLKRPIQGRAQGLEGFFVPPDEGSNDKRTIDETWLRDHLPPTSKQPGDEGFRLNKNAAQQERVHWNEKDLQRIAPATTLASATGGTGLTIKSMPEPNQRA